MTFSTCTVQALFPAQPRPCGMLPPNTDGVRPITLTELTPPERALESRVSTEFAERFREASESDRCSHLPCIWTARMLANAACCPDIRFINPIPLNPALPQIFHVERMHDGQTRQETIYYHQHGSLNYLLPVRQPDQILPLSPASIAHLPERVSRTLTCCLNDVQLKGVAITFEEQAERTTILWLKA